MRHLQARHGLDRLRGDTTQTTRSLDQAVDRSVIGQHHAVDSILSWQQAMGNEALPRLPKVGPDGRGTPPAGSGQLLDTRTRLFMESRIGQDFSGVRVHTDGRAAESAHALGALAYTVGADIVFGAGRYQPRSRAGVGLLAHELTHVAHAGGRPSTVRRAPDPARLDVAVPDASAVAPFEPAYDYAWQNPVVRASLFRGRESAFREFLVKEKKKDLDAELAGAGFTTAMADDIGEQILTERVRLTDELAEHTQLRKQAQAALRIAQAETRKHLAEPEVREHSRQRRALEEKRNRLARNARGQQARIAELEKKGDRIGAGELRELDKRRGLLADLNAELEPTEQSLREVSDASEADMAPLSSAEARLRDEIKEHLAREGPLQSQLDSVRGGVDRKQRASREAAVKWRIHEFSAQISGMEHDELLGLVLDEFATDKSFTRFSKQERYLIIHFSGMRYASANASWAPPQELLSTLKQQQVREVFADADEETLEQEAQATGDAIESELSSKDIGGARKAELLAVKKGLDTPAAARTRLFGKNPKEQRAFEELQTSTRQRAEALARGDSDPAAELSTRIDELNRQIGAPRLKRIGAQLADADRKRLQTLLDFRVREARQAMSGLTDLQALSVLQDMKDAFPRWVWHEVVRRTQLRVNATDPDWDDSTVATKGTDLDPKDPVTTRWRAILGGWPRESNAWNEKHSEEYQIVAATVVCNQLAEHAQHLYGKNIDQGIRGAVGWYRTRAAEAKAKGVTGANQAFFVRPTKAQEFVAGSALFWAHFETKKKPDKANMAHLLGGIDFLTEGKQLMRDGLVEGDWTYHIDAATGDITRTKGHLTAAETQWFSWQHEATVIDRAPGTVTTFETSGGARMHAWSVKSLLDPMSETWIRDQHGDTNVFLGFAPEGKTLPQLDDSLKNILPGRNAL